MTEAEQPIQILDTSSCRTRWAPASIRGGAPFCRDYRFLEAEAMLQVRADRRTFRPFGLRAAGPARPPMNWLNSGRGDRPLPSKFTCTLKYGDVFRQELPGGGGWGDPLERDPAAVLADVRNELVSVEAARAITASPSTAGWTVDAAATGPCAPGCAGAAAGRPSRTRPAPRGG